MICSQANCFLLKKTDSPNHMTYDLFSLLLLSLIVCVGGVCVCVESAQADEWGRGARRERERENLT